MKTLKKKKKGKMRKNKAATINISFTFTVLLRKIYILSENMIWKTWFKLLNLYYSFFAIQVIGNAVIKHQRSYRYALAL